jgi:hypothetical protein
MKGGAADGPNVGLLSGEEKAPTRREKIADLTSSFSSSFSGNREPVTPPQDLVSDSPYALWQEPAVAAEAGAGSDGEFAFDFMNSPQPAPVQTPVAPATPTAPVQTPVAPATQSSPVQQPAVQPVVTSGPPAVQQVVQEPQVQSTVQVVQQQVQPGQLTRQQAQRARRKKAQDLLKETQKAVIEAAEGEADLARERAAAAAASVAAAAAAAAEKAEPYVKMAAKLAAAGGVGTGVVASGLAAAPLVATAATAAVPFLVPAAVGAATLAAGGVAGKFAVNKTMQLGSLMKKGADKKTLIWAIKVLAKEGWQFILPDKTVATSDKLDLALGWIEKNYKSAKEVKPDQPRRDGTPTPGSAKPDQPRLDGTPTPGSV